MTFSYTTTDDDILALNRYYTQSFPLIRRRIMGLRIFYALLLAISIVFFAYLFDIRHQVPPVIFIIAAVSGIVLFAALAWLQPLLARNITRHGIRDGRYQGVLGQQTLTITPEGLIAQSQMGESKYYWNAFVHTGQTTTHLFLFVNSASAVIIPKRAFPDEATCQALLSHVARRQ